MSVCIKRGGTYRLISELTSSSVLSEVGTNLKISWFTNNWSRIKVWVLRSRLSSCCIVYHHKFQPQSNPTKFLSLNWTYLCDWLVCKGIVYLKELSSDDDVLALFPLDIELETLLSMVTCFCSTTGWQVLPGFRHPVFEHGKFGGILQHSCLTQPWQPDSQVSLWLLQAKVTGQPWLSDTLLLLRTGLLPVGHPTAVCTHKLGLCPPFILS